MNKITLLGTGTSTGVPILGCECVVCQSNDVRNKRLRTSALIETHSGKKILIDATPDLRTQLLNTNTKELDAVIITHDHADHTHGMDDLRPFGFLRGGALPVYADELTTTSLRKKFSYIFDRHSYFKGKPVLGGGIPLLDGHVVSEGSTQIEGAELIFYSLPHGHENTLAVCHGKMAYITDVREIPETVVKKLSDAKLELLIIDCLRPLPHQTHLHFDVTMDYIEAINPRTAILTHLGHEWDYLFLSREIMKRGVKNTFPGIDGQSFLYS